MVTIGIRTYLSISFIQSAAFFTRKAFEIENLPRIEDKKKLMQRRAEYEAYVLGALLSTATFLEATINELFSDASDWYSLMSSEDKVDQFKSQSMHKQTHLNAFSEETLHMMGRMWKYDLDIEKLSILDKYQKALELSGSDKFNKGALPYQPVDDLVKLRNTLLHYKPETQISHPVTHENHNDLHKLAKRLRGKFSTNPFTGRGNVFFPDKCLSHGCAVWCIESAINFTDSFFSRLNALPTYNHVRKDLSTK